ncbi:hypothetical protein PHSC3_001369 [Chlamydiales bacterium STE3]|nr:hypothetical protein PHSC3_001369 [Chlamydiales bacterium STE3]
MSDDKPKDFMDCQWQARQLNKGVEARDVFAIDTPHTATREADESSANLSLGTQPLRTIDLRELS